MACELDSICEWGWWFVEPGWVELSLGSMKLFCEDENEEENEGCKWW